MRGGQVPADPPWLAGRRLGATLRPGSSSRRGLRAHEAPGGRLRRNDIFREKTEEMPEVTIEIFSSGIWLRKNGSGNSAVMNNAPWGEGKKNKKGAINREMRSYGKKKTDSGNF
ncbi:uncharacterized protein LOC131393926 isoform X2 [Diceros bicornis minor]|uniref:uncharacterized protein LOC131393926 isoform X2 n=1 Tax=Diceros bicornis minor TaxID=77932 RepID=UPI0026EEC6DB|nr:uncharacterized protein LOC131393926 isoform X2 [Diceros bicornis minor]